MTLCRAVDSGNVVVSEMPMVANPPLTEEKVPSQINFQRTPTSPQTRDMMGTFSAMARLDLEVDAAVAASEVSESSSEKAFQLELGKLRQEQADYEFGELVATKKL